MMMNDNMLKKLQKIELDILKRSCKSLRQQWHKILYDRWNSIRSSSS